MNIVAERFIELSILRKQCGLNRLETKELNESLDYLERLQWEKAKLKNLSLIASMIDDTDWQHEICNQIDQLNN